MPKTRRKVNIIGHRNPDTDSLCSALAYTYLKNQLGDAVYEARRAGQINRETAFVLKHFGVEPPRLCTDVSPQVKDIDIREQPGIDKEMSIRAAWSMMLDTEIDTLCAIDEDKELLGLITVKDIANANMDLFDTEVLAKSKTSYKNVLSTLEGEMLLGDPDACITSGRIFIGTSPEIMDGAVNPGDIVLVSNRYEVQMCAIDCGAGAIVVCCGSAVPRTILARAQEKGCIVITTPFDTYAAARLISTAAPVRHFMRSKNLLEFSVNTAVEDARKVMANVRHRYFPILDANGKYCGVISRRNLLNVHRKQVIMVDHNERGQAVDGLEQAEILEIIDHHRLGALETAGPVYFRNEPVGCTATIISRMYEEHGIEIPPQIAGLLLSAILSDTHKEHHGHTGLGQCFRQKWRDERFCRRAGVGGHVNSLANAELGIAAAEYLKVREEHIVRRAARQVGAGFKHLLRIGGDLLARDPGQLFGNVLVKRRGGRRTEHQRVRQNSGKQQACNLGWDLYTVLFIHAADGRQKRSSRHFCRKHWPRPVCPWCSLCAPICVPRPQTCCSAASRRKKLCAAHSMWKPRTAKLCCPGLSAAKSS